MKINMYLFKFFIAICICNSISIGIGKGIVMHICAKIVFVYVDMNMYGYESIGYVNIGIQV